MRRLRILIASSAILAIGTSSFAGDFQDSVAKAARGLERRTSTMIT